MYTEVNVDSDFNCMMYRKLHILDFATCCKQEESKALSMTQMI